jgi:ABC-type antimicrobial peptide transport system ATPase subunit
VYFLGLIANQRELFQVGRDLNAQTGNLSPLVAAGIFYLMLTVPLTHLVNYVDGRLRRGRAKLTHEMGFARSASDAVVFMDLGKVVEFGTPEQIFEAAETERLQRFLSQVL